MASLRSLEVLVGEGDAEAHDPGNHELRQVRERQPVPQTLVEERVVAAAGLAEYVDYQREASETVDVVQPDVLDFVDGVLHADGLAGAVVLLASLLVELEVDEPDEGDSGDVDEDQDERGVEGLGLEVFLHDDFFGVVEIEERVHAHALELQPLHDGLVDPLLVLVVGDHYVFAVDRVVQHVQRGAVHDRGLVAAGHAGVAADQQVRLDGAGRDDDQPPEHVQVVWVLDGLAGLFEGQVRVGLEHVVAVIVDDHQQLAELDALNRELQVAALDFEVEWSSGCRERDFVVRADSPRFELQIVSVEEQRDRLNACKVCPAHLYRRVAAGHRADTRSRQNPQRERPDKSHE